MHPFLNHLPLLILVWLPILVYYWALYTNRYWKRHNVPYIQGTSLIGNMKELLLFRKCTAEQFQSFYNHKTANSVPFIGIHIFHKPALVLRDPELIKRVLVKDFSSFSNRHSASDIHSDALGGSNLFLAKNPYWKVIRPKLTPFFTSSKLKRMFYLMNDIGIELNTLLMKQAVNIKTKATCMEVKDLCTRYTTDILASCEFGVQAKSLNDPNSEFLRSGRAVFDINWYRSLELMSLVFLPEIIPFFRFKAFSKQSTHFFRDTIEYVMDEREKNGNIRNDLIDTLVSLRTEDKHKKAESNVIVFQGDVLVSQAAIFFSAGFESSSAIMSFGLYELSWQPKLQNRIREEIAETLSKCNGELTYDIVQNMEYLGMVTSEILRMYPPLPFLDRECTVAADENGYSLDPFSDYVIPRGMPVFIPIFAIQRDPKYFPQPERFDPERFSAQNKHKIVPFTYMPFGLGPHNCIGERFGQLQTRIGYINFFRNHRVSPSERTPKTMTLETKAMLIQCKGGVILNVIRDPIC